MENRDRRHDIDWLRVIAIALLIIYHTAIGFQPWGILIGFIQNKQSLQGLWIPMSMLNIWRIPLLFFVSGMGVCFAMRKRSLKQLIGERAKRILVPFLFGIAAIVPLHLLLWQKFYDRDISYVLSQSHLWFLGNIFSYVIILLPLFFYLRKREETRFSSFLQKIFSSPGGLLLITIPFIIEAIVINPDIYETYSITLHGYLVGLLSFFFGFTIVYSGNTFWNTALRWRWLFTSAALSLFICRYIFFDLDAPGFLKATESVLWIFSAFGFSYKYLNRPSELLTYLSTAAYPVYILHMLFLYLASYFIMPSALPASIKLIMIITLTFAACLFFYEFIIRRIKVLRPLFGLK